MNTFLVQIAETLFVPSCSFSVPFQSTKYDIWFCCDANYANLKALSKNFVYDKMSKIIVETEGPQMLSQQGACALNAG